MSRRSRLGLGILAVLVVIAGMLGGGYAFLYFTVKRDIDALLSRFLQGIDAHYDSLWYYPWNGKALLTGLTGGGPSPFRIERIVFEKPDRDMLYAMINNEGASMMQGGDMFARLTKGIEIEGVKGESFNIERLYLGGLDVRLSALSLPATLPAWPFKKAFPVLISGFRFETMTIKGATLRSDEKEITLNVEDIFFSGVQDRKIDRLNFSGLSVQDTWRRGDHSEENVINLGALKIEEIDGGHFFEDFDGKILLFMLKGKVPSLEELRIGNISLDGVHVQTKKSVLQENFDAEIGHFSIQGLQSGILASLKMEKISAKQAADSFHLGQIQIENFDINEFLQDQLDDMLAFLNIPSAAPSSTVMKGLRFTRHGIIPVKVGRILVEGVDLDIHKERRLELQKFLVNKTYQEKGLVVADIDVQSLRITPKTSERQWDKMRQMGYDALDLSFKQKETFMPENGRLSMQVELTGKEMGAITTTMELENYPRALVNSGKMAEAFDRLLQAAPKIRVREATARIDDHSLIRRWSEHDPQFRTNWEKARGVLQRTDDGSAPRLRQVMQAIVSFLENPGTLNAAIKPDQAVSIQDISRSTQDFEALAKLLNLSVSASPLQ